MVGAPVKRDNVKGLCKRFDSLVGEYPETFDMIAETDFTTIFSKCCATFTATLRAWRVHLGFVRISQARLRLGLVLTSQAGLLRRRVSKGDEFNKAAPAPQAPAAPAPAAGENGARPVDEPPTPPAGEGAEAGAGNPGGGAAPGDF